MKIIITITMVAFTIFSQTVLASQDDEYLTHNKYSNKRYHNDNYSQYNKFNYQGHYTGNYQIASSYDDDDDEDERLERDFKKLNRSFRVLRRTNSLGEFKAKFKQYQTQLNKMMNDKYSIRSNHRQNFKEGMEYLQDQSLDLQEAINDDKPLADLKDLVRKLNSTKKKYHDKMGVDDDD